MAALLVTAGSAFAYHLGLAHFGSDVLRRGMATPEAAAAGQQDAVAKADEALTDLIASGRVVALP